MSQRTVEDEALLDATQACVLAVGVRRTTMTDVARRAGVSRMTLYRRYADVTSLMQALMTREFTQVIDEVEAEVAALPSARERLVTAAVGGVDRLTRHPLFLRILDVDPELLLPYLTTRRGAFQRAVVAVVEARLADGVAEGSIAVADRAAAARTIELALRGFAFQTLAVGAGVEREQELAELRLMLDRYLAVRVAAPGRGQRVRGDELAPPGDEALAAGQARAPRSRRREAPR
ncbi:MAG TPA: TetR/AcrR family transcriptional regulator [Conexibacter sp.]|nr:TetR/AcrR family transcriptional regulator [Conexibacter sp.]